MADHARLSPSSAHRWMNCPGSVREEAKYPNTDSPAARDGTRSHYLLELALRYGRRAEFWLGETFEDSAGKWTVHQDRVERVQMCLDYVERRRADLETQGYDVEVDSEMRVYPGEAFAGRDDWWGTSDIIIKAKKKVDFK